MKLFLPAYVLLLVACSGAPDTDPFDDSGYGGQDSGEYCTAPDGRPVMCCEDDEIRCGYRCVTLTPNGCY